MVVALACLLAAGAVGCSDAAPAAAPVPSTAPIPSTSAAPPVPEAPLPEPSPLSTAPVVAKPGLPTAATVRDAAGAQAYVRYWYELTNYAYATGDSSVFAPISHPDCVGCQGLVDNIATATDVGGTWQGLTFMLEQFETAEPDQDGISLSTALVLSPPGATVRRADGTVVPVKGSPVESVRFWSQWNVDHWQTFEFGYPDDGE